MALPDLPLTGHQNTPFGRFPSSAVKGGHTATLRRAELRVYLVLAAHASRDGFSCYLAMHTIANLAGIAERSAQRALKGLAGRNLVTIDLGGGRGNTNIYALINPDTQASPFPAAKPRHSGAEKGDKMNAKPRHPGVTRTDRTDKRNSNSTAAAGCAQGESGTAPRDDDVAAAVKLLVAEGIAARDARPIAKTAALALAERGMDRTVAQQVDIAKQIADDRRPDNRPGFIRSMVAKLADPLPTRKKPPGTFGVPDAKLEAARKQQVAQAVRDRDKAAAQALPQMDGATFEEVRERAAARTVMPRTRASDMRKASREAIKADPQLLGWFAQAMALT